LPRWALDTLGEDAVLCCLRAEYSQKALESFWRHRDPKISRDMATWLGLSAPEMMALWFGADDARTPSLKSVSHIYTPTRRRHHRLQAF
jgi:hypothetical protein